MGWGFPQPRKASSLGVICISSGGITVGQVSFRSTPRQTQAKSMSFLLVSAALPLTEPSDLYLLSVGICCASPTGRPQRDPIGFRLASLRSPTNRLKRLLYWFSAGFAALLLQTDPSETHHLSASGSVGASLPYRKDISTPSLLCGCVAL